jgi:CheY-like chemotaxis protein
VRRTSEAPIPETFVHWVRDALLHLYDPIALQTHPLSALIEDPPEGRLRGAALRQQLLDALEALHPPPGTASPPAHRAYRILELRYLEGQEIETIAAQLALSRSQYHREHQRALYAVARVLWDRWRLAERWPDVGGSAPSQRESAALLMQEVTTLCAGQIAASDPADVLAAATALLRPLFAQRGIQIAVTLSGALPPVRGERLVLRHALLTLLGHLLKALASGDTLAICAQRSVDGCCEITITGPARGPLTPEQLGLPACQPLLDALQAQPYVSIAGDRWLLRLTFPAQQRPLLLIVDNNPDFVRLVTRWLTPYQWEVQGVGAVSQAYQCARTRRPTAILLDVLLPDQDGWDGLLLLKSAPETREIPVIVCSVLDEPTIAVALGAAAYLQKPIQQAELVRVLRALPEVAPLFPDDEKEKG